MQKTKRRSSIGSILLLILLNIVFGLLFCSLALFLPDQTSETDVYAPSFHNELAAEDASEPAGAPVTNQSTADPPKADESAEPPASKTIRVLSQKGGGTRYGDYGLIQVNNTSTIPTDFPALLARAPALSAYVKDAPEVLVVHTHTTESFLAEGVTEYPADYGGRSQDESKNIVAVGDAFTEALRAKGINVMHDHTVNDYPKYSGSYTRTAWIISEYLKKYPSIRCVIDVHRDSITAADGAKYKLIVPEKQDSAQVTIVSGCYKGGLSHPNYEENLRFAMRWQEQMNAHDITLARPINFVKYRYNQHLTTGSLILEVGTEANSLSEATRAAALAGTALADTLLGLR